MSYPLLLDEMFSEQIAVQVRKHGHDVNAVVADPELIGLPDEQVLAHAAASGSALVTANIKDYVPLDSRYKEAGRQHAGLILVSTKTFPQDHSLTGAITGALDTLLSAPNGIGPDRVVFLARTN